jgi:thiol:disulfide interchange protein DsbC
MIDLKLAKNLTELSRRDLIVEELASFPDDELVIFRARDVELAVLNVFTDTSCGYCQKLHREVGYLQDAGISVRYFPYPRGGTRGPGYRDLQKVWCAEDRATAMSIAKGTANGRLDSGLCDAAKVVDQGYDLGNRIGVTGTPALFAADGTKFNGYVPYQELIPQLLNN